jgi:plastocyanin
MKFSTALSMAVAPVAMARRVANIAPPQAGISPRSPNAETELSERGVTVIKGMKGLGITASSLTEVIIIWANPGSGAATTTINQQVTVTQTVTVGGKPSEVAGKGATHTVKVGGPGGLAYQPDSLSAKVGDTVVFEFLSQNHTVTQSPFDTPCKALAGGMDSGFLANPNNTVSPPPQVAMQVMTDKPLCKSQLARPDSLLMRGLT